MKTISSEFREYLVNGSYQDFVAAEIRIAVEAACKCHPYGIACYKDLQRIREEVVLRYPSPNYSGERPEIEPAHQQALYSHSAWRPGRWTADHT